MGDLHFKELPKLVMRLAKDLSYRKDVQGLWRDLERTINNSLHMFNSSELIMMYYAMIFKFPKACSQPTREAILKLIMDDFDLLTIDELVFFIMTNTNNRKLKVFERWMAALKSRSEEILRAADQKGPEVLVNYFYAYVTARIPPFDRKTRGIEQNALKEANEVLEMFVDKITDKFDQLTIEAIYRLGSALENSKIQNVNELYSR